jgi:hypothetical protein
MLADRPIREGEAWEEIVDIGVSSPTSGSADSPFFTDEELTSLALAADPHAPLDPNAVPWHGGSSAHQSLLPDWYMPSPMAVRHGRATQLTIVFIIVGFLVIDAFGLCITSGFLSLA